jgi:HPt (histidine-containing phosphotransfer) domain-containing protein
MNDSSIAVAFPDAYRRLGKNAELLAEIAAILVEDTPNLLEQIHSAVKAGNYADVAAASHSLKGLVGNLDESLSAAVVQPLVDAARVPAPGLVRRLAHELDGEMASLLKVVRQYL